MFSLITLGASNFNPGQLGRLTRERASKVVNRCVWRHNQGASEQMCDRFSVGAALYAELMRWVFSKAICAHRWQNLKEFESRSCTKQFQPLIYVCLQLSNFPLAACLFVNVFLALEMLLSLLYRNLCWRFNGLARWHWFSSRSQSFPLSCRRLSFTTYGLVQIEKVKGLTFFKC